MDHEKPRGVGVVLSVDPNQCKGANNSFSVIQVWAAWDQYFYLLDQWCKQCTYGELWTAFRSIRRKYNPTVALIERTANGYALLRDAKSHRGNTAIVEIIPDQRSKETRLAAQMAQIKGGRIRLPLHADFVASYIAEFTARKRTTFDQIDATVQYLAWAVGRPPVRQAPARAIGALSLARRY